MALQPVALYPKGVPLPDEAGHDESYRYIRQ